MQDKKEELEQNMEQWTGSCFSISSVSKESPVSWEISMQDKKEELEQNMEQWTGSKLGKKYVKVVYRHTAYLTYMQNTWCKCQAGWISSWNQDSQEKYQ